MIIDFEQERRNLDESQLARDVMRIMGLSLECNGEPVDIPDTEFWECPRCGRRFSDSSPILQRATHLRLPKPLREVRDELIAFVQSRQQRIEINYDVTGPDNEAYGAVHVGVGSGINIIFREIADEATALALGAVRLMGKQDANSNANR